MPITLSNVRNRTVIRATVRYGGTSQFLTQLLDVSAQSPANNDVIVYNSTINKYVSRPLTIIDGGTF